MSNEQSNFLLPQAGIDNNRLLETLFEGTRDGVAITDAYGRIVCCNAAFAVLAQRTVQEVIGRRPTELWKCDSEVLDGSTDTTAHSAVIERPDGSRRTVAVRAHLIGTDPQLTVLLYRDITHLKMLEQRDLHSDSQYKFLLEQVNDGILVTQNDSIVYANSQMAEMLGYSPAELFMVSRSQLGKPLTPAGRGQKNRFEAAFSRADGAELPVEVVVSAGFYGAEAAVYEVVRDIHERRRAERRAMVLLTLGQKLNLAATVSDVARVTLQAAQELIGWHAASLELIQQPDGRHLEPVLFYDTIEGQVTEVAPPVHVNTAETLGVKTLSYGPMRLLRDPEDTGQGFAPFGDTSRLSLSLLFAPIRGADGAVGVISVQSYDVNAYNDEDLEALQALAEHCSGALQRTIAVTGLRASEVRYRQLFEKSNVVKLVLQPDTGGIVDANSAACTFYGYSLEGLRTLTLQQLTISGTADLQSDLRAALAEQTSLIQAQQRLANGERRTVEISTSPVEIGGRKFLHAILHDVTQRERAIAQIEGLAELGRRLSSAVTSIEAGRILVDVADKLIGWHACFVDLFASEVDRNVMKPGHLLMPVVHIDLVRGRRTEVPPLYSVLPATSISYRVLQEGAYMILRKPEEMRLRDGQMFGDSGRPSASLMYVPIRGASGVLGVLSLQSYDFDAYAQGDLDMLQSLADACGGALERTHAAEQVKLLESAVWLSSDMVIITSNDPTSSTGTRIVFVNDAVCRMTGYSRDELLGKSLSMLQGPETDGETLSKMRDSLLGGKSITVELVNYRKDGTSYIVEFSAYTIADAYGRPRYFVSVQRDITARKRTEQELVHRAFHDPLTGLANRALLFERLEHILARASRSNERFSVLFLDLDGFKEVNDQYGHAVGDQLLTSVARRLETCVRPGDTVARFGGDEFVILLEGVDLASDGKHVAGRVLEMFSMPYVIGEIKLQCATSIGIANQPEGPTNPNEVLRVADEALYRAKAAGKNRYVIADEPTPYPANN